MHQLRTKFIHIIVILAMLGSTVLDFRVEAIFDVDQIVQLINVAQSYGDDGMTKTDPGQSSKIVSVFIDDVEDHKLFLTSQICALFDLKTSHLIFVPLHNSSSSCLSVENPPVRAPPVSV